MPKKTALVVAPTSFAEDEFQAIRELLRRRGIVTAVVAPTRSTAAGSRGMELEPDLAIGELNPSAFDALIFIGGDGAGVYRDDPAVLKAIHQFQVARRILAAINDAPQVLADAGALMGRTVTAAPEYEQYLRDRGADYTGMPVEVDHLVVTAQAGTAQRFAERLAYLLGT